MTVRGRAGAAAALAIALMCSGPAAGQLVLSCFTLHNDLANFDRRADAVGSYFMPEYKRLRHAAAQGEIAPCADQSAEDCEGAAAKNQRLRQDYLLSHLGGADPVRLRIIDEMRKLGCPLPDHVVELLALLDGEGERSSGYRTRRTPAETPLLK